MMHTHFSDDENSDDYSGSPFPSNDTGTSTSTSLQSESQYQANVQSNNGTGMQPTIALFGAGSKTATHFMRLALDAGYHVRALLIEHEEPVKVKAKAKANAKANTGMGIETTGTGSSRITAATGSGNSNSRTGGTTVYRQPPPSGKVKIASHIDGDIQRRALALREEFADQTESLCWIPSETIFDTLACQRVLREADYVVCMMDDSPLTCFVRDYKSNNNTSSSNYNNDENYDPVTRATKTGRPQNKSNSYQDRHAKASTGNITSGSASERPYDKVTPITSFLQILYPLMKDVPSIQVILFQASSLAVDVKGRAPIFSKVLKSATAVRCAAANLLSGSTTNHHKTRLGKHSGGKNGSSSSIRRTTVIVDQDAAVQEIAWHHRGKRYSKPSMMISSSTLLEQQTSGSTKEGDHRLAHFSFIITRPTNFLKEGPSMKKVSASKSQPGPFPIAHIDLAEFSLNALLTKNLYNTCPYVVADSF